MKQSELRQLIRECINEINIEAPTWSYSQPTKIPIRIKNINKEPVPDTDYYFVQLTIDAINLDKRFKWYYFETPRTPNDYSIVGSFYPTNGDYDSNESIAEYKRAGMSFESQLRSISKYDGIKISGFHHNIPHMRDDFYILMEVPKELVKIY